MNNQALLLVFVGLTGLAVLMQAAVLFAIFISARKAAQSLEGLTEDLRVTVLPIVRTSREIIERIAPKIDAAATDLADITGRLRVQSEDVQVSATEILDRIHRQTLRIDGMLSGMMDSVDRAAAFAQRAVNAPVRQLSGVLAALRAIVEALRSSDPAHHETHSVRDKETFI